MRIFNFDKKCLDKRYIIAFCIVLVCGIICGIVLNKSASVSNYLKKFSQEYVYNVYYFKSGRLFIYHFLIELVFLYAFYFLSKNDKIKFFGLLIVFLRAVFIGAYISLLLFYNSFAGIIAAVFVYVPSSVISVALYFCSSELNKCVIKKYGAAFPLVLALSGALALIILLNVIFRVVIVIV